MMNGRIFEARVRELARDATSLPAPADAWERIAERVQHGEQVLLPLHAPPARTPRRTARVAALLAVVIAAGAAALPASPVHRWLAGLLGGAEPPAAGVPTPVAAENPVAEAPPEAATRLLVEPASGGVMVVLIEPTAAVRVRVRVGGSHAVRVEALGEAAAAQFRSAAGQLTISDAQAGEIVLSVPSALPTLRVLVDGQTYLTKQDGQFRVLAPAADTAGSEIVLPIIR